MVAVLDRRGQMCGGTLVASKYVVSAAHCMFKDEAGKRPYPTNQLKVSSSMKVTLRTKKLILMLMT